MEFNLINKIKTNERGRENLLWNTYHLGIK